MDIFVAAGQMLVLFAMMFTGYFLARRDWINDSLSSALSRLVVNIFNPFLMISSVFGQSLKQSGPLFWQNLVLVGIFYLLLFLAGFFIVFVLRPTSQTAPIYKLLTLLPNCGFMGIPIVSSLLGAQYIIYVAVYMLVFNLIIYTYGISPLTLGWQCTGSQHVRQTSPDFWKYRCTGFSHHNRIVCNGHFPTRKCAKIHQLHGKSLRASVHDPYRLFACRQPAFQDFPRSTSLWICLYQNVCNPDCRKFCHPAAAI